MLRLPKPASFWGIILLVAAYDLLLEDVTTYLLPCMATMITLPDGLWLWAWRYREAFFQRCLLCFSINYSLWIYHAMQSDDGLFPWATTIHAQRPPSLPIPASWNEAIDVLFLQVEYLASTGAHIFAALPFHEPATYLVLYLVLRAKKLILKFFVLFCLANLAIWIALKYSCDAREVIKDLSARAFKCIYQVLVYGIGNDEFEPPVPGSFPVTKSYGSPESDESSSVDSLISRNDPRNGRSLPLPSPTASDNCATNEPAEREFEPKDTDTSTDTDTGTDTDTDADTDTESCSCCDEKGREKQHEHDLDLDPDHDNVQHATNPNVNEMESFPERPPDSFRFHFRRIDHLGRRNAWDWTNIPTVRIMVKWWEVQGQGREDQEEGEDEYEEE
ncbi:uncharacterized protein Z520_04463 [Fonsecaea multimorphosa CBS 102226]|uniref:Uncharacterized protein n=1 Tax=Fonsecaea multimorphosa CBS 102226 TaxID=1442371 RepID=A0A0D2K1T8_9EURO|nr:uncharacterized protein Z520_04463 [Fonsecaea multimorphosa CBS 102226]KIX99827.1 hypothetical protein Z520_04463 [Fonsecaea multimorphosa CBS 102226]OAL26307.1 hypothetical protein AYO22_04225 [Fonsecaea multimorphosa]